MKLIDDFPVLYKRTKTGAIQYYKIHTEAGGDFACIVKESGQLKTDKPVIHREEIKEGKNIGKANETTPLEQALRQAESDWTKKHDEGYKSQEDLGIGHVNGGVHHGVFSINGSPIVPAKSLAEILGDILPQFNTDASGNVKPMLAKAVNWDKVQYPCYVQPKLDGVRCLMIVRNREVNFLSRSGKPYTTLSHIEADVRVAIDLEYVNDFILDGEIYSHDITFQQITAAVKKTNEHSRLLKFRAYDMISDETQFKRVHDTCEITNQLSSHHIKFVNTLLAADKNAVKHLHDAWVAEGFEGAMIRHHQGVYGQGQRSSDLLKVKEFDETEYNFLRFETGQRDEDLIAVCLTAKGQEFRAKVIGTREQKEEIKQNACYSGAEVFTIKHFGLTDDGIPRFPIGKGFRDYES